MATDENTQKQPPALFFNVFQVSHTPREFFFMLGQGGGSQSPEAQLIARVVTTPQHTKAILRALQANIEKYEAKYGEIAEPELPDSPEVTH